MTRCVCHFRKGAVRGEYVIAAAVCIVLLLGMVAVLVVQSTRMNAPRVKIATPQNRAEIPAEQPQVKPNPQPPQAQARPNTAQQNTKPSQNNDAAPVIIVTEEPDKTATPAAPTVTVVGAKSAAYPSGEPKLVSAADKTRIDTKDYDNGGEGVAYHDDSRQNEGRMYRPNEGVGIEKSNDSEGEYAAAFIKPGEWINYTIRVAQSGEYKVSLRVSRGVQGDSKMRILFDGADKTGDIAIPSTGGFSTYKTIDAGQVELAAGEQVMRLDMVGGDFNIEWVELTPASAVGAGTTATETVRIEVPGDTKAPEVITVPVNGAANSLQKDVFADVKVGQRPTADGWAFSPNGTFSVLQELKSNEHVLRIVDQSTKADAWVRRSFPAQKEKVVFTARLRFGPQSEGAGISLLEKEKPGVLLVIQNGQLGYIKDDNKWYALTKLDPVAYTNLRIEANAKDHKFAVFINDKQVGEPQIPFRNWVGELNAWSCGTSVPQLGTIYIQSVEISN